MTSSHLLTSSIDYYLTDSVFFPISLLVNRYLEAINLKITHLHQLLCNDVIKRLVTSSSLRFYRNLASPVSMSFDDNVTSSEVTTSLKRHRSKSDSSSEASTNKIPASEKLQNMTLQQFIALVSDVIVC